MTVHSSTSFEQKRKQIEQKLSSGKKLFSLVPSICDDLFLSGDFSAFLDLLSRFPHHNIYNLLLIFQQYPSATCLALYDFWSGLVSTSTGRITKKIWEGKGIDLLAPYFACEDGQNLSLVWGSLKVYDLSQTNVEGYIPPISVYDEFEKKLSFLLDSLKDVICMEYHYSIIPLQPSEELRSAKLYGQVNDHIIHLREDIGMLQQISWLAEQLVSMTLPKDSFSSSQLAFAEQCILYCLCQIWKIELPPFRIKRGLLKSIEPSQRMDYLNLILHVTRRVEDSVLFHFNGYRQSTADLEDIDFF